MINKHTPAAWTIYEGYDATVIRTTHRNSGEIIPRSVAEVTHHGEYHERNGERTAYQQATVEDRTNAHLIAAAPELLGALEIVKRNFLCADSEKWKVVNAAIAKAKGEV